MPDWNRQARNRDARLERAAHLTSAKLVPAALHMTLDRAMAPHGYNAGLNLGRVAGAGVEGHIHMHVVPRWNGDTNFMPVLADVRVMPEHLSRTLERVRDAWNER